MGARTFVAWCLAVLVATPVVGMDIPGPRVRGDDPRARWVIRTALKHSSTTAELVRRLEGTDVLVYVSVGPKAGPFLAATRLMNGSGDVRFIWIRLSGEQRPQTQIELLGHELQHVMEIAMHPEVRDAEGMRALFSRIGRQHAADHFETRNAIEVGRMVRAEIGRYPAWLLEATVPSAP